MKNLLRASVIGVGLTSLGKTGKSATQLMQEALESALSSASVRLEQIDGLIAVPSMSEPRFMQAHYLATKMKLLPHKDVIVRTIDTGGAGPISGLLEADRMIRLQGRDLVAVVAGDAVSSLPIQEFLLRADSGICDAQAPESHLKSPIIPHAYDRVAQWQINTSSLTREQLAMVSVLMSRQAIRHPFALTRTPHTLSQILESPSVAPVTNLLECARRADGGAAIIVASSRFLKENCNSKWGPIIVGGGEGSGPLYPPAQIEETMFSCEEAAQAAYDNAHVGVEDIDFFALYDCFPICFVRAVEAVKLAPKGGGGDWVESFYKLSEKQNGVLTPSQFPLNTHGGLLAFGAPWEVPAMYNVIEAIHQLNGTAGSRQVPNAKRALVYGNGGVFSASAVAILRAS
eukprot:Sdes_comp18276_c0_seq1m7929